MQGTADKTRFLNQWMPQNKVSCVADFLLSGMVVGPLIAPFLAGVHMPGVPIIAQIIYFMGQHVCPQPEMGIELSPPFIMAVCMRCYGTVTGLFLTRMLYLVNQGRSGYWLHQYGWWGVGIASVLMAAYPIELAIQTLGIWEFDNTVVSIFGLITGLAWGLHAMPILHGDLQGRSAA
ncbi:DUF2085 domain-containing protein [filamentous cyanobacterium LEGE 11480]|uniref:DUF2085 domain-containing protein n=1 Tax=Romeriopsis navalis LEGE 11480 TaxID=2777977 RepID=A0A928VQU6_9CYAN|nr:DUF2085 domain-containing protein [Romeriopsis navalis]MBE9032108.1 DUF2085 domain-containing protein [Romeriopsis navalis LEGE 11480]